MHAIDHCLLSCADEASIMAAQVGGVEAFIAVLKLYGAHSQHSLFACKALSNIVYNNGELN